MADAGDLKSLALDGRAGSSPALAILTSRAPSVFRSGLFLSRPPPFGFEFPPAFSLPPSLKTFFSKDFSLFARSSPTTALFASPTRKIPQVVATASNFPKNLFPFFRNFLAFYVRLD